MANRFTTKRECQNADIEETESFLLKSTRAELSSASRKHPIVTLFFMALNVAGLFLLYVLLVPLLPKSTFKTPVPSIEYEIRSFAEEYNRDTSVVEVWDSKRDYPPFDGFTFIDNAGDYNLPPGAVINGKADRYGTAWTHQYHCLELIHSTYEAFVHNLSIPAHGAHHRRGADEDQKAADIHHMRHCFDYLRQHIICAMDMRLEYPTTNPNGINGYAIPRKCVKREPIDNYMKEHGRQHL